MNVFNRAQRVFASVLTVSALSLAPVWADDTEIFFGDVNTAGARPNVLFIIDTSGSMRETVSGTGKDRLDNVKDGFRELLTNLNDVNVGLMRFSNPGGPILYPVSYIDEDVNEGKLVDVFAGTEASNDDAQEGLTSGTVEVSDPRLELTTMVIGATEFFEDSVSTGSDDAEERISSGSNWDWSNQLDFLRSLDQRIGVRFQGSSVPANATIINAYITFTGRNDGNTQPVQVRVYGEADDTTGFGSVSNFNLRDRVRTGNFVDWNIIQTVAADQTIDTPNLAAIVQDIIGDPDWIPGGFEDDMVFIFEPQPTASGSGERDFFSRNGSSSRRPRLFIEYYVGAAPTTEDSVVGVRFRNVNVPKGVKVTSAYIQWTAAQDGSGSFDFTVHGENSSSPQPYSTTNGDISGRSRAGSVSWTGSDDVSSGEIMQTADISSIVETIADRSDWCGGNDMAFMLTGSSGFRTAWSHDGNISLAPKLVVQYEYDSITPGASCYNRTVSKAVNSSSDDVEEYGSWATTTSTDLDFISGNLVGLRFTGLNIPANADISSAYLELTSDSSEGGTTTINIAVENTVSPAVFSGSNGVLEDRSYAASAVGWTITNSWVTGTVYRSPDIKDLVSTIVRKDGWDIGDNMAFKLTTTTSTDREAESYNSSPGEAARLVVQFKDDGSGKSSRLVRDELLSIVEELNHEGWTPIQDTLFEAASYYKGGDVTWGAKRGGPNDGGPHAYTRVSHARSMKAGSFTINRPAGCTEDNLGSNACRYETIAGNPAYESPIQDVCQANSHIILLTDGFANLPHSASLISNFIGGSCANTPTINPDGSSTALSSGERCVKDLVKYIKDTDLRPDSQLRNDVTGADELTQSVTTHTIGFNFSSQWLEDVAIAGGGVHTTADNSKELVEEIKAIIGDVLKTDSTFVAPVAAVNQFNRLNHLNQIYFAVFRPDEFPQWPGNVKKYKLGITDNAILDATDNPAIDATTGFFSPTARSLWSASTDGSKVDLGGAASNMPGYASRTIYTYYAGSASTNLSNSANLLTTTNTALTKAMFDATSMTDAEFDSLIEWVRGRDTEDEDNDSITGEDRYSFADPLHSKPVAITYGGSEASPDVELFVGTNAGAIHAIDASNGVESFAFFPEATLPMQQELRKNQSTTTHPYGMDGSVTPWVNDNGNNGISTSDTQDFVRIYTGMRRGGRNYYALDVTDRNNPEVMWVIEGGSGSYGELGQTWASPVVGQIKIGSTIKDVLFISGGYDEAQDNASLQTSDGMGRAIYIVDAVTGALLWSGGKTGAGSWNEDFADMDYSIPGALSVGDVNGDGLADAMFIADVGGQLWRFDIKNGQPVADLVTGGVVADLGVAGGTNSMTENRRFYHRPSVALIRGEHGPELAVTVGSGFRPSPLSTLASNRSFMIRQTPVFAAPSTYTKITASSLYNATENLLDSATGDALVAEQAALNAAQGWYFDLPSTGEKVLSSPLITDDTVVFTTFQPGSAGVWCRPTAGTSRVYQVDLYNATPVNDWDDVEADTKHDRYKVLKTATIIDEPTVICTGAGCKTFIGTEDPLADLLPSDRVVKTFWRRDN